MHMAAQAIEPAEDRIDCLAFGIKFTEAAHDAELQTIPAAYFSYGAH
jgi:hypothetical protein